MTKGTARGLTRLLDRSVLVTDQSAPARSLAFTVVGVPLHAALAAWTRHTFRTEGAEGAEAQSLAWAGYVLNWWERTEVVRGYESLVAGSSLIAAAVGLTMVIVALVEALTSPQALLGTAAITTLPPP